MIEGSANQSTVAVGASCSQWECFATAVRFLTRVPMPGCADRSAAQYAELLRGSAVYFPLVGGLVGSFSAAVMLAGLWLGASPVLAALIAVGMEAMLTGAFHEDAFADTCDALGGGWTRERILEIMKCSQLGTYGVLGLVVGVGARVAALAALSERGWVWTLAAIVAAAAGGRLAILWMMATTLPITDGSSTTKTVAGSQNGWTLLTAAGLSLPLWIGWIALDAAIAGLSLVAALGVLYGFRHKVLKTVYGTTGDLLGCSAFLTQLILTIGSSLK